MKSISEVLQQKGYAVSSVSPSSTVYEALVLMANKNIGAVLVLERDDLVGIFSERDYARKVVLAGKASRTTEVREVMTCPVATVALETSVEKCLTLMTEKHIRHLPVFEGSRLLGVVSIGDIVKAIISEQRFMIGQLENYIRGDR